jgi:SAM-dependent methyltransferase
MSGSTDRDYVLGTHDEEVDRLGLQHRVWRPTVLACWQRVGIQLGSRVLDVGAGPGYAALDLAEIVGHNGSVVAVERSGRFVAAARGQAEARRLPQLTVHELDLMTDALPAANVDAAWCRWVAAFVASPDALVAKLAQVVRPGGVAVFHEYADYATWRFVPPAPAHTRFVEAVMASWRASGGEPDIGRELPRLLAANGFKVREVVPHIFALRPHDPMWQWPASFIDVNVARQIELQRIDATTGAAIKAEFAAASSQPESLMLTPLVLEIVAERNG